MTSDTKLSKEQREECERLADKYVDDDLAGLGIDEQLEIDTFKAGFTAGVASERHISNMLTQEIRKVLPSPTMDGMDKWNHTQKQIHYILERHYSRYQKGTE